MPVQVSFHPSKKQIAEVEKWLIEEQTKTGEGFYCNWRVIEGAINDSSFGTISSEGKVVGFVVWTEWLFTGRIDIMEIKPSHRGKGFGKLLTDQLLKHFVSKDIMVVDLQCSPAESEPVWRKLGFINFPESISATNNKELYRILVPYLKPSSKRNSKEILELWNTQPYEVKNAQPSWEWNLKFKRDTRELIKPIVYPAISNWRIRWTADNKIMRDEEVRRFGSVPEEEIDFRRFVIIKTMPSEA